VSFTSGLQNGAKFGFGILDRFDRKRRQEEQDRINAEERQRKHKIQDYSLESDRLHDKIALDNAALNEKKSTLEMALKKLTMQAKQQQMAKSRAKWDAEKAKAAKAKNIQLVQGAVRLLSAPSPTRSQVIQAKRYLEEANANGFPLGELKFLSQHKDRVGQVITGKADMSDPVNRLVAGAIPSAIERGTGRHQAGGRNTAFQLGKGPDGRPVITASMEVNGERVPYTVKGTSEPDDPVSMRPVEDAVSGMQGLMMLGDGLTELESNLNAYATAYGIPLAKHAETKPGDWKKGFDEYYRTKDGKLETRPVGGDDPLRTLSKTYAEVPGGPVAVDIVRRLNITDPIEADIVLSRAFTQKQDEGDDISIAEAVKYQAEKLSEEKAHDRFIRGKAQLRKELVDKMNIPESDADNIANVAAHEQDPKKRMKIIERMAKDLATKIAEREAERTRHWVAPGGRVAPGWRKKHGISTR